MKKSSSIHREALVVSSNTSDLASILNLAPVASYPIQHKPDDELLSGLATVANMGAEVGATTSTFPYTANMRAYLTATRRGPVAHAADEAAARGYLSPDEAAEYDEVIEIVRFI